MAGILSNPKARRDYAVLETVEAGIVLRGTEVKSLRAGGGQLSEAYASIENGEAFLHNAHIDEYAQGNRQNHQPKAVRKLLLHQSEIRKLFGFANVKGHALIPLAFYWKNGKVKVALGVCQSKRQYDKREQIKQRESDQQLRRLALHKQ
jgi:SsrA-binding protein